jgi:hypothetical protein
MSSEEIKPSAPCSSHGSAPDQRAVVFNGVRYPFPLPLPAIDDDTPLVKWQGGRPTIQEAEAAIQSFQLESLSAD